MKLDLLTFQINNDKEKFVINLNCPENIIHACDFSYINLIINDKSVIIGKSIVSDFTEELKKKLELALIGKLKLHSSIKKDIGYYWNQILNEENLNLFSIQDKEGSSWVGYLYLLWTTDSNNKNESFATWLYNDAKDNIIFEVTPTYPDTFIDKPSEIDLENYKKWLQNSYNPFFLKIISKDIVIMWLKQVNLILKEVENVYKK